LGLATNADTEDHPDRLSEGLRALTRSHQKYLLSFFEGSVESSVLKISPQLLSLCLLLVGSPGVFAHTAQANQMTQAHQALQNIAQLPASATVEVQLSSC